MGHARGELVFLGMLCLMFVRCTCSTSRSLSICKWWVKVLQLMSWQEESVLVPSVIFHVTILFLFDWFSRSLSFLSKQASRVEANAQCILYFSTSSFVNWSPFFKSLTRALQDFKILGVGHGVPLRVMPIFPVV